MSVGVSYTGVMLSASPKRVSVLNKLLCVDRELRRAADGGDMPALRRALKQGAEVDAVDCSGFTALHLAAEKGHSDIVDELLAQVSSLQRSLS